MNGADLIEIKLTMLLLAKQAIAETLLVRCSLERHVIYK